MGGYLIISSYFNSSFLCLEIIQSSGEPWLGHELYHFLSEQSASFFFLWSVSASEPNTLAIPVPLGPFCRLIWIGFQLLNSVFSFLTHGLSLKLWADSAIKAVSIWQSTCSLRDEWLTSGTAGGKWEGNGMRSVFTGTKQQRCIGVLLMMLPLIFSYAHGWSLPETHNQQSHWLPCPLFLYSNQTC